MITNEKKMFTSKSQYRKFSYNYYLSYKDNRQVHGTHCTTTSSSTGWWWCVYIYIYYLNSAERQRYWQTLVTSK
jgi:hypothetical protein